MNEIGAILAAGDSATEEPSAPSSAGLEHTVN